MNRIDDASIFVNTAENIVVSDHEFFNLSVQDITKTERYTQLVEDLRKISKVELHAHLSGAVSGRFLRERSTSESYNELSGFIEKIKEGIDTSEGFKVFGMIGKILNSDSRIEEAAYDFCQSQYADRVTFSELRTGLKNLDGDFESYLNAVLRGLEKGMKEFPVKVNLVLSLRRDTPLKDAEKTIDLAIKYRERGITGIDVSGESIKGDGSGIFQALKRAKENGFPTTLHIGESFHEKPEQQLKELMEMQPDRVGHAITLCQEARKWVEDKQIVVEACIRSAIGMSLIKIPGEHPAMALFKKGHPVVFCSDDSTLFGDLSNELALVAYLCNLSIEQVVEMQAKALTHSFTS